MNNTLLMKKQCVKIRFSILWIPYIIFLFVFHLHKTIFIVFGMLMVHELGHIVMSKYLGIHMTSIVVYPFGIFAEFDDFSKYPSYYELFVAIGGPLFQIMNFIILNLLYQYHVLSLNQVDYYHFLNVQMAMFNLLPIFPLDGGRILHSFCIHFFTYTLANKITLLVSSLVFILCVLKVSSYWSMVFLCLYFLYLYREFDQLLLNKLKFYYNRCFKNCSLPIRVHSKKDLYQDYENIIVSDRRYDEKQWLQRIFPKKFH